MATSILGKRKRLDRPHPYLVGNFAPIQKTCPLTPCRYTGNIPDELAGGQYVRNSSNPISNDDLGREAHWFDGDGMLSGVSFNKNQKSRRMQPEFVNQYILTDVYLSSLGTPALRKPILPSIATLVNPLSSLIRICLFVFRAVLLVILSRLPGSKKVIKKISVANTSIMYHDGRALATCESGPPMRISLPELETVGWFDGNRAEGEPELEVREKQEVLGGEGIMSFMKEWTTAHPKVDPVSKEMMLFHSTFAPPYVHYSVLPSAETGLAAGKRLLNRPVAGVSSAKMMHDFGVSRHHTVIMDLPLTLDPLQMLKNQPPIVYDGTKSSRFGVFPRHDPSNVRWFEASACCIFHTVNTWDVFDKAGLLSSVDMLACRMTSASVVFNAGNIAAPQPTAKTVRKVIAAMPETCSEHAVYETGPCLESHQLEAAGLIPESGSDVLEPCEEEQCRLYYYSFSMAPSSNTVAKQFALSAIPFEFPSVRQDKEMQQARFVYGCTTIHGTFNSALGRDSKIDGLVKFDTRALFQRALKDRPHNVTGCVDERSASDVVRSPYDPNDPVQIFQAPANHFAQEPRFVPSKNGRSEDDGFLLTYIFDESQLGDSFVPPLSAFSELWIIDAKGMKDVIAKIQLPQRVPYGLHGNWFSPEQVANQRPVERVRKIDFNDREKTWVENFGQTVVNGLVTTIGG